MSIDENALDAFTAVMKRQDSETWNRFTDTELRECLEAYEAYEAAKIVEQPDECIVDFVASAILLSSDIWLGKNPPDDFFRRVMMETAMGEEAKRQAKAAIAALAPKQESILPDPETLDKNGTIEAIQRIQREAMAMAKPYQTRLVAYAMSEPPAPIVTEKGIYAYKGPLPPTPEVKCNNCSRLGYHDDGCMNDNSNEIEGGK